MPLIILGLLLLICLLTYSVIRYIQSGRDDIRPVRERYPEAFRRSDKAPGPDNGTDSASYGDAPYNASDKAESSDDTSEEASQEFESYVESDSLAGDIEHLKRELRRAFRDFLGR